MERLADKLGFTTERLAGVREGTIVFKSAETKLRVLKKLQALGAEQSQQQTGQ